MTKRSFIWPYQMSSSSARDLARSMEALRIRSEARRVVRKNDVIINWGNSDIAHWWNPLCHNIVVNQPTNVASCINKLRTYELLKSKNILIPEFSTTITEARNWFNSPIKGKFNGVLCRTMLRASGGRGIVLAKTSDEVVNANLYTRYIPKSKEFRVHVSSEYGLIDIQEKRKRNGFTGNQYLRNFDAGWVFCREDVKCPDEVISQATEAVIAMGLDFGAVDIGWDKDFGTRIYEINTAPGIEGTTLDHYSSHFTRNYL